jgi:hypothetical protein
MTVYKLFTSENKYVGEIECTSPEEAITMFRMLTGDLFDSATLAAKVKTDRRKTPRKGWNLLR